MTNIERVAKHQQQHQTVILAILNGIVDIHISNTTDYDTELVFVSLMVVSLMSRLHLYLYSL